MTLEREQAIGPVMRLVEEAINGGRIDVVDELLAADYVDHADYLTDEDARPGDRDAFRQMLAMHRDAFSGLRMEVAESIVEDDHVMVRSTLSGRHTGTLYGIPASGNDVSIGVIEMFRISDGKIIEHWWCRDDRILYRQIGGLPPVLVARIRKRLGVEQPA